MFSSANFGMPQAMFPRTGTRIDCTFVFAEVMLRLPAVSKIPSSHILLTYLYAVAFETPTPSAIS